MNPADVAQSVLPLTSSDLSLFTLFWHAHWIVKFVMLGLMVKDKNYVENAPPRSTYSGDYQAAEQRVLPLSVAGFATAGVGLAAVIAGVIWKVSEDGGSRESAAATSFDVLPGGVRVRF